MDWNKQLRDWRMPNRLEKCSGGYTISWAPNLGGYGLTSVNTDRKSGTIQISSSVALDAQSAIHGEDYMYDYVGGHELGHVLGFSDTSCGQSNSIMNGVLNPSTGHVQTMTCADLLRFYDDRKNGYGGGTTGSGGPNPGGYEEGDCRHEQFGEWDDAKIEFCSPIVIDLDAGPFEMSPPDVWFNLTGKGPRWFGWTPSRSTTVGWLALDRDGDGMITSGAELFGNFTPLGDSTEGPMARHGFEALAWFDQPSSGGNGDGWVDRADGIYGRLRMWFDENHDGVSQRAELQTLTKSRVLAISVRAFKSQRRDKFGNEIFFRSETRVVLSNGAEVRRPAYDVLLVVR